MFGDPQGHDEAGHADENEDGTENCSGDLKFLSVAVRVLKTAVPPGTLLLLPPGVLRSGLTGRRKHLAHCHGTDSRRGGHKAAAQSDAHG